MSIQKLGRYDLNRVIGKGAMGLVYEGRDPNLDRRVAIKTILVENLTAEAIADYEVRFKTEAKSAARLQHPNIVSVYDSDRDGNIAYLVMEFIQGEDLKHHLDRGVRFQLDQSIAIVRDLLSALDYAHRQNVIHRDVKPANLLLEASGRVKLTDFGVARIQDSNEVTRTQGSIVGTLKYMAPEQVQGHPIDARTDLFAAGVVLYQLLTGRRPFDDDNDFAIMHQIIGKDPEPPSHINPQLPKTLDGVVAKALAKSRNDRFASARDFALALQSACRRATDTTVVPPVSVSSQSGASQPGQLGTGPGIGPSNNGTSPSTVTQELELVYWKDVKDTTDVEELQGFLARFPVGIYADLAQRRIRKLTGLGTDGTLSGGTQTQLAPGAVRLSESGSKTDTFTSTHALPGAAETPATDVDFDPLATVKMLSDDQDATQHMPIPALNVDPSAESGTEVGSVQAQHQPQPEPTIPTAVARPAASPGAASDQAPSLAQTSQKNSSSWVIGLALAGLLVVGIAAKALWPSKSSSEAVPPTAQQPAVEPKDISSTASAPLATPAQKSASAAALPAAAASKQASKIIATDKASSADKALKTAKPTSAPDTRSEASASKPITPPPADASKSPDQTTKPAVSAAPAPAPALSPKAACEGKVLLSYHNCMLEQCARPGHQHDPACIERQEIEQRSRNRQF